MRLRVPFTGLAVVLCCLLFSRAAAGQGVEPFFKNNCAACHTIGKGPLVGPDLKGVTARRDRSWLTRFIPAPIEMIQSGDAYALNLQKQSYGMVMPSLPALTPTLVNELIDYIDAQSGTAPSQPATAQPSPATFTAADVNVGRAFFSGRRRLAYGGPPCMSCHTVRGLGGLGGGHLAPDLTLVSQRLGGERGLTAWLGAPATPTMQSLFGARPIAPSEVPALVAYFEHSAGQGAPDARGGLATFALLGFGSAIVGLAVMGSAWKNRFRNVRRSLVERAKRS